MSTKDEPTHNPDGTLTALTEQSIGESPFRSGVGFGLLRLNLPPELTNSLSAGRYFLARCGAQSPFERATQWGIYFRRPLFLGSIEQNRPGEAHVVIPYHSFISADSVVADRVQRQLGAGTPLPNQPQIADPGYEWLSQRGDQEPINLMGPFGNGFVIGPDQRNLLLVADGWRVAHLLPLIDEMLNRGGRVTVLVAVESGLNDGGLASKQSPELAHVGEQEMQAWLLPKLPIAVELRLAASQKEFQAALEDTIPWADQLCAALPEDRLPSLAMRIRDNRFHLQEGFAQVLVDADLICGVGACLACVVSTANGSRTRACVHGPVFDLTKLAR